MPSNWIKAGNRKRYGDGEIYAFEHEDDALRWAGRMDWELHKATGLERLTRIERFCFALPGEVAHPLPQVRFLVTPLPLARLARNEERKCTGRETGGRRRME